MPESHGRRGESASDPHEQLDRLWEAKERFATQLLQLPGVHGVGIGFKEVAGKRTPHFALVVAVAHKLPRSQVDARLRVPERLEFVSRRDGSEVVVATDVQQMGRPIPNACSVTLDQLATRVRPVPGGCAIASPGASGTLGGWTWDNTTGQFALLSNEHVLGSVTDAVIMQPFFGDPTNEFGTVLRAGRLDAAIGRPLNSGDACLEIVALGPAIFEITGSILGMEVQKTGAFTKLTSGTITTVGYTSGWHGSTNDMVISPTAGSNFSIPGDSGSVVLEKANPSGMNWKRAVGLLWGSTPDYTQSFAHEMKDVFVELNLTSVCEVLARVFDEIFLRALPPGVSSYRGFARDFARRLASGQSGSQIVDSVSAQRVGIVQAIRDDDSRRALEAAIHPLFRDTVTTDDLLSRVISEEDVNRFVSLLAVAARVDPTLESMLPWARRILKQTSGRSLGSALITQE
jgi:hypothetical protein